MNQRRNLPPPMPSRPRHKEWIVGKRTPATAKILAVHEAEPGTTRHGHGRMITIECIITGKPRRIYVQHAHHCCTVDAAAKKILYAKRAARAKRMRRRKERKSK